MGRYYSGDINGKFWFAIQASDDANFFGVNGTEPNYLEYYFDDSNIDDVQEGVNKCLEALGDNKDKLDKFFQSNTAYSEGRIAQETGIDDNKINEILQWYARLELGQKILNCIKENGSCQFEAEL